MRVVTSKDGKTRLSKNLWRHEFACKCGCGSDFVDIELVDVIQAAVYAMSVQFPRYRVKVRINSGTRCMFHNAKVGGSTQKAGVPMSGSKHLYGIAADVVFYDGTTGVEIPADLVADYFEKAYPDKYGIGRYVGRTHIDVRPNKARWDMR